MPEGVSSINGGAFNGCVHLTAITVEAGNTAYSSRDGVLFDLNQTNLIRCPGGRTGDYTIPDGVTSIAASSFGGCASVTSVTAPPTLASIGISAFAECSNLTAIYFQGDAPVIYRSMPASYSTIYYLPGTTGWGVFFDNRPTVLWDPRIQTDDGSFGVQSNRFGFNLSASSELTVVVEASASLTDPTWAPVGTNTLAGGSSYFSDPEWTHHPARYYRLRSP